jgi:hypothetical protein
VAIEKLEFSEISRDLGNRNCLACRDPVFPSLNSPLGTIPNESTLAHVVPEISRKSRNSDLIGWQSGVDPRAIEIADALDAAHAAVDSGMKADSTSISPVRNTVK